MTQRRWDPRTQQPVNLTGRSSSCAETRNHFLPQFSGRLFQLMHARLSVRLIKSSYFHYKKHPMILKSGYHNFLVKRHQMNSLHVHVMFSLWQVIWITLSQRFEIKGKRERMWNIYIWKPHGDDRQQREKYRESDCKETCVAELSNTNFTHNF